MRSPHAHDLFNRARHLWFGLVMLAPGVVCAASPAKEYPAKVIRLVVPTVPGGASDYAARLVGRWLTEAWGQQVVIDNRPGGSGTIGVDIVAKSVADGYTLLIPTSSFPINPSLYPKLPFDTLKDFELIALVAEGPLMLVVNPSLPATSVAALIELAKSRPGQLNYANSGDGSAPHLAGELFKRMAGLDIVSVAYKGGGPALVDVISGRVQMWFAIVPAAAEHVKGGKLRALAVTSLQRLPQLANIPTMAEAGVPGFEINIWLGVMGPQGLPQPIKMKLNQQIVKNLQTGEARERLAVQGLVPGKGDLKDLRTFLQSDVAKWAKVVRETGIKLAE